MSTVEEYLNEYRGSINCNACGNCCEGIVSPCAMLRPDRLCEIHPQMTQGEDRRRELVKSCDPQTDPLGAGEMGYFCPPLADEIFRLSGIKLVPTEVWNSRLVGSMSKSQVRAALDNGQNKRVYFDDALFSMVMRHVVS